MIVGVLVATSCGSVFGGPDGRVGRVVVGPRLNGGEDAEVGGVVDTSGECVTVRIEGSGPDNGFVWPNGTGWDSDRGVVLPNGRILAHGDTISGGGGYHTFARGDLATPELLAGLESCGWDPTTEIPWLQHDY